MSSTDHYLLGAYGAELEISDLSRFYVVAGSRTVQRDGKGVAIGLGYTVHVVGTDSQDMLDNLALIEEQLRLATLACGPQAAGAPIRMGERIGDALTHRYWVIGGGYTDRVRLYPSGVEMDVALTQTIADPDGATYGEPVAIATTGTLTNGSAVFVLDDVPGDLPANIALTLTAVSGTPAGYRVGILPVPAGTVAGDFDHVVDLSAASGASSTTTSAVDVGSNYRNRAISSGSTYEAIGTATQPAGAQNQGKRHVYLRGYDAPGTPTLAAPASPAGTVINPVLSGGQTQDTTTYDTPVMGRGPITDTNANASAGTTTPVTATWSTPATTAGSLWIAAGVWWGAALTTPTAPTLPSGWQLYSFGVSGADATMFFTAYRRSAASSTASQTFTFNHASTTSRNAFIWMAEYLDVGAGFPFSGMGFGALTVLDAGSGAVETVPTALPQVQPNELALAFTIDMSARSGGVEDWVQGWESLYNGTVDIGYLVQDQPGTIKAYAVSNLTGAADRAAILSIIGSKATSSATIDQTRVDSGNLRVGTYNLRVQAVNDQGVGTPTSSVPVSITLDGSRIDASWSAVAGATHYLLSWSRPQGGFRQVAVSGLTYSITDDETGRVLGALPTTAVITSYASRNRLVVGTAAEQGDAAGSFTLPPTSMHTVHAGTFDLPPIAASSDGERPSWGITTQGVSGNPGVSATIRHDALFIFPTDAFVTMYAKGTARAEFFYELRPDGYVVARTEGSGNVGKVVAPSELKVWPGSNVFAIEALGTRNASIEDCFASNLALTFTAQVTYTPRYRG